MWYVVEAGEETERGRLRLMLKKAAASVLRLPSKGYSNLYLNVVAQADSQGEIDHSLDSGLWQQLPALLVSKILLDHLPFDHLLRLANGDAELTAAILAQPLKQHRCALILPDHVLLHNFEFPRRQPGREWRRLALEQAGRPLALSPHGLLFIFCASSEMINTRPRFKIICHSLADGGTSVLEPLPDEFDDVFQVDAGQVIHPEPQQQQEGGWYKFIIMYAACSKALAFDSRSRSWSNVGECQCQRRLYISSKASAIESWKESDAQVILPLDLYCRCPLTEIRTVDSIYTFLLGAVGKPKGNHIWEQEQDAKNGIDHTSPVVLAGLKMDELSGDWEILPGPDQQACKDMVLADLRCIGVTDGLGVFADSRGRLLSCQVEPWGWYITNPTKTWCDSNGKLICAVSP